MLKTVHQRKLYEQDFVVWCEDTIAKLEAHQLNDIDLESLIEEIRGLAGRDRRELKSRLEVLLYHLLKRLYVKSPDDFRGWELTIREQRRRLQDLLEQSPSLKNYLTEVFPIVWQAVLADAREDYPKTQFPDQWTFELSIDALLTDRLW